MQSKYKFLFLLNVENYYSQIINNVYLLFEYESDKYCDFSNYYIYSIISQFTRDYYSIYLFIIITLN